MSEPPAVEVQPHVHAYAESLGTFGIRWLSTLPERVARVCQHWTLQRGDVLSGGSRSYVCRVTTPNGQRAVLKVALPEATLQTQLRTLIAAKGNGYVHVLAHDLDEGALLMESLATPVGNVEHDISRVLDVTTRTLRQAWQVPRDVLGAEATRGEYKAAGLLTLLQALGVPNADASSQAAVRQAIAYALDRLATHDPTRDVVVHGDAHAGNLLRVEHARAGAASGYVLIDPEGFLCEPEYDLGVAVRAWNEDLLAATNPTARLRGWCEQVAEATDTNVEAIWQWAFIERVTTGLYLAHHGLPSLGAPFLRVAARLLA
ncbi:aminoglycoside phosphotransferase family protein [Deinococcus yavapaiensis]|uniref:Streptomycin 6-kinase n=1 Tax=Deinococcus yavapaiensis KR-236 TaxID=694435 RepID=A0A318S1W4_9DEIO|nr:aminoglycoside phosphotransferase family protein [Deinococcus yavapaiensis]PYE50474.1 streptomycin 6-kinase [Deinococcus yavapaiensis KR-236]